MQRLAIEVGRHLNTTFGVSMVAYLDDWLIFGENIPDEALLQELRAIGFTINERKSILQSTTALTYLGLRIDTIRQCFPTGVPRKDWMCPAKNLTAKS
jgi:hypothetical protein